MLQRGIEPLAAILFVARVVLKLTTKGRYAVMALADIAARPEANTIALSDISVRQGISLSYLEQLFSKLRRAGIVNSARGVAGGYFLARSPDSIRVSEIVEAVDEQIRTTACNPSEKVGCRGASARCLTHDLWDELGRQIEIFLNAISLADVVEGRVLGTAAVNPPRAFDASGSVEPEREKAPA
ncbi:MAG: Rrf2 family transcriptional regulator [Pseudomonadota bacterium]